MKTDTEMKLEEALQLLNEAAKEQKDDFINMLTQKYKSISETIAAFAEHNKEEAESAAKVTMETLREGKKKALQYSEEVDACVHKHPWPFVFGAAVGSLLVGAFLRSGKKCH